MRFFNSIFKAKHNSVLEKNKVAYLDGLRGAAAITVVLFHFMIVFYPGSANGNKGIAHLPFEFDIWLYNSPFSFWYNGDFAVFIFFVLSGYVLTKSYFEKSEKSILVKRVLARYPRLFIPSTISMIFAYCLFHINAYKIFYLNNGAEQIFDYSKELYLASPLFHVIKNIFFGIYFQDPEQAKLLNTVLWTMGIEFQGSLLVLSMAFFIKEIKYKNLIVIFISILVTIFNQPYGTCYTAFLLGMLFAANQIKSKQNSLVLPLLILALFLGGYFENSQSYLILSHHSFIEKFSLSFHFYHMVGAIIFTYCVLRTIWLQKIFNSPIFIYAGKISFSLYLMHQPIIYSLSSWIVLNKIGSYNLFVFIAFMAMITTSIFLAYLMTETVDSFSVTVSSQFAKRMVKYPH